MTNNNISGILQTMGILLLTCLLSPTIFGQKMEPLVQLSFLKKADQSKHALVKINAKNKDNKLVPASNAHINFYAKNKNELSFLKQVITDEGGKASINLPNDLSQDTDSYFSITAKIENDSLYEDTEEEIHYKEANLMLRLNQDDTTKMIVVTVTDGDAKPIQEVEVSFFVQRLFGLMPASEEYVISTSEGGEAVFTLPKNIMGDTTGNIIVVARIDNNEVFGTIEIKSIAQWGIPLAIEQDPFPRALLEPRAPVALIITFLIIFGGVWITYFFILFQLRKVNNEKREF